jgi:GNAT superfamily N-acetyltransferase
VREIELAEGENLAAFAEACGGASRVERVAGGVFAIAEGVPVMTRACALVAPDDALIDEIGRAGARIDVADPELRRRLDRWREVVTMDVWTLGIEHEYEHEHEHEIAECDDGYVEALIGGFGDEHEKIFRTNLLRGDVRRFVARYGGELAGAASMSIHGGVVTLFGTATLPAHRRKGVQTALLRARLAAAASAGARLAVVLATSGHPTARNAERLGFTVAYRRAQLALESRA